MLAIGCFLLVQNVLTCTCISLQKCSFTYNYLHKQLTDIYLISSFEDNEATKNAVS